ncbi:lanthionine synthetase LanC family protein [Pedobacter montanisoli]|uniref:Lanthionine synthetase n=1 Tax=Pedobacter montanisoli TaxID=2923277 RepID=A0ABS9ZZR7_9SPHI|nr:lanthionine synthetase LanC family protein [Pedobacter montanisoli]MCJ0743816.1 hypothetical protein [Pedobacter montanisoli]
MKEEIASILNKIYSSFQNRDALPPSLLQGEAGYCLFEKFYVQHFDNSSISKFQDNLQNLAENSIGITYPTFCNGKAGINWFFSYLNKNEILSKSDWNMLCDDDMKLANDAINFLKQGHYDFLHGAIGIAYHLLYSRGHEDIYQQFFHDFIDGLQKIGKYHNNGEFFIPDFNRSRLEPTADKINFGLAHGIPSIIKFCLQCYKQKVCIEKAKKLVLQLVRLLKNYADKCGSYCYFPTSATIGSEKFEPSRLGWCYGDLGIGIIIYQTAIAFNDKDLENYALKLLMHTTNRRTLAATSVYDADVCHGASGISHIYNRMWHYTNDENFKNARDYWMKRTLEMAIHTDGVAGYKTYYPGTNSYNTSYSFLDGPASIGLTFISYLTGDFSWDYCLMLND